MLCYPVYGIGDSHNYMDKVIRNYKVWLIFLIVAFVIPNLLTSRQSQRVEERKIQVLEAQWYAEYQTQIPSGKTAEMCFDDPPSCL